MTFESFIDFAKLDNGKDGQSTYVHIKYSDVENPTEGDMTNIPTDYIGFYTGTSPTPPTDPSAYTWFKIKGENGRPGQSIPGEPGRDGQNSYIHIKYSNDGGRTFTANDGDEPGDYMGIYTDQNIDAVLIESFYTWMLVRGAQGVPGGSCYFHIAYSANPDGNPMTLTPMEDTRYMGVYSDFEEEGSVDYTKYTWNQIQGNDGIGIDGTTYYMWVKYADDPEGEMTDNPDGKDWIGIAYNQESPEESDNNEDYTWSKFRGPQGVKGDAGGSLFMWVKYANTPTPSPEEMSDDSEGMDYMGIAYNKEIEEESTDYHDYKWLYIRGEQGIPGVDNYLHIKYSDDGGVTFTEDNGETLGSWIGTCVDRNAMDPTEPTAYKWAKFMGEDGKDGLGYTIALSNENHGFAADGDGVVQAESIEIQVCAWLGKEPMATTVSMPENIPDGMTISIKEGTNGTLAPIIVLAVDETFTEPQGVIEFPIMCDGLQFAKVFSYCVVKGGKNGVDGRVYGIDVSTPFILAPFIHRSTASGGFQPGTVTFEPYYRDGPDGDKISFTCDIELKYSVDGETWVEINERVTDTASRTLNTDDLNQNAKHVKCLIYTNGGVDVFCEQSVLVKDNTDENARLFSDETGTVLIQGSQLVAGSVSTTQLAANSVTAAKISVTSLSAITGNVGTLNAGIIHSNSYSYSSGYYSNSGIEIGLSGNGYIRAKNFGIDSSGNAYFKGNISGSTGTFSGTLSSAGGTFTGTLSGVDGTFSGTLSGANGSFSGSVTASSGRIGPWNITDNCIYKTSSSWGSSSSGAMYFGNDGLSINSSFKVSSSGILTATGASIGGSISATSFTCNNNKVTVTISDGIEITYGSSALPWIGVRSSNYCTRFHQNGFDWYAGGSYSGTRYQLYCSSGMAYFKGSSVTIDNNLDVYDDLTVGDYSVYGYKLVNGSYSVILRSTPSFTPGVTDSDGDTSNSGRIDLGSTSNRWKGVYSTSALNTSSDINLKEYINDIDERYEKMFMDLHPVTYMFKNIYDHDNHDRIHCGLISQEVNEAAEKNGLSSESFAAICRDDLEDETTDGRTEEWGLMYGELHGIEIHMIQKALKQIEELETTINELKQQIYAQ